MNDRFDNVNTKSSVNNQLLSNPLDFSGTNYLWFAFQCTSQLFTSELTLIIEFKRKHPINKEHNQEHKSEQSIIKSQDSSISSVFSKTWNRVFNFWDSTGDRMPKHVMRLRIPSQQGGDSASSKHNTSKDEQSCDLTVLSDHNDDIVLNRKMLNSSNPLNSGNSLISPHLDKISVGLLIDDMEDLVDEEDNIKLDSSSDLLEKLMTQLKVNNSLLSGTDALEYETVDLDQIVYPPKSIVLSDYEASKQNKGDVDTTASQESLFSKLQAMFSIRAKKDSIVSNPVNTSSKSSVESVKRVQVECKPQVEAKESGFQTEDESLDDTIISNCNDCLKIEFILAENRLNSINVDEAEVEISSYNKAHRIPMHELFAGLNLVYTTP